MILSFTYITRESIESSSNKWTKTLFWNYLHRFVEFCATIKISCRNEAFLTTPTVKNKFWKYWWNETDDEILPVIAQLIHWPLMFIFLSFHGKLLSVLFQSTIYILSFRKMSKRNVKYLNWQSFCPFKTEKAGFSILLCLNPFIIMLWTCLGWTTGARRIKIIIRYIGPLSNLSISSDFEFNFYVQI